MARNRVRQYAQQAALEALVRFGPELSGLTELQRQAQDNYSTGLQQANQTARGIDYAARAARPEIVGVYNRAGGRLARQDALVADDLAALGPAAKAIATAAAVESGAARGRLREARANSVRDLAERRVQARSGRAWAVQNARRELVGELGKVQRRRADVLREQGAFTAATLGDLLQADMDRRTRLAIERMGNKAQLKLGRQRISQQERNSLRSAGVDPDTGRPIPGGKADSRAKREWATPAAHAKIADQVSTARQWVRDLLRTGASSDAIVHMLKQGRKASPVYRTVKDPQTGKAKQERVLNPDGTPRMTGEIPKIASELLLRAALEAEQQGYVSRRVQRMLHRRGLRLSVLGLPTYGSGAKKRRRQRGDFNTAVNRSPGGDAATG